MEYQKIKNMHYAYLTEDDYQLYDTITVVQKVAYNVLKKACEHATEWHCLKKLESMQADIAQGRDGAGADLVQSGVLFLLEYAQKEGLNPCWLSMHMQDEVLITTKAYDNSKKCYKTKNAKLIQALYKYIRSLISLEGASDEDLFVSYIDDYDPDDLDGKLFAVGGYSRLYANDSPDSNEDIVSFLRRRREFEETLTTSQLRVFHLLEVGGLSFSEIADKLHVSRNSVVSAKREIQKKALNFWTI